MKRGRHDNEYARVRQKAGLNKPRYDFPDDDVDVNGRRAADRVAEINEDFRERMAKLNEAETKQNAEAAARHAELRREWDRRIMLGEWKARGVEPPNPLVSVDLALSLGCRIEQVGDKSVLVLPERPKGRPTPRREDYGNVDGA